MSKLLILQLLTSFLVGGGFIAFLSFAAERASEKVAGIIISLPSTIAISLFFMGWALSPQKVAQVAPVLPLSIGIIMIFACIYTYLSKIKLPKIWSIVFCASVSVILWLLISIPLAIYKFSDLRISVAGYIILTTIAYYFLSIRPKGKSTHILLKYSTTEKFIRAGFAGCFIALAVYLSKTSGPFWGGVFSGFPAVYLSTLMIFHWHYDSAFLFKLYKNSPLGSIPLAIYPIATIYTFPTFGIFGGTLLSYAASLACFFVLTTIKKRQAVTMVQD